MNSVSRRWLSILVAAACTPLTPLAAWGQTDAVIPQVRAGNPHAVILVGGIRLGASHDELLQLFAQAKIPLLRDLKTIVEYGSLPTPQGKLEKVRLHFHKTSLYKVTLVHSEERQDGYEVYHAVKNGLAQQYGEDYVVLGDDAATVESVAWEGLHDKALDIEIVFQAVGKVVTAGYIHKPLYEEYLKAMRQGIMPQPASP
ncbi:MAG: hypothetical protein JXR37_13730 [Kiritimatiellae bacterium]|nr:hypothetical protein [Kiritimatiellia bacterium]